MVERLLTTYVRELCSHISRLWHGGVEMTALQCHGISDNPDVAG